MRHRAALVVLAGMVWATSAAAQGRDSLAEKVREGDAAWERSDHAAAFAAYDAVVRVDTAYSTRALFRLSA